MIKYSLASPLCYLHSIALDARCDLLRLHHTYPDRYPYLLESVAHGSPTARYDILFGFPGQTLTLTDLTHLKGEGLSIHGTDFLNNLDVWWLEQQAQLNSTSALPFRGGWFVYLGYELAAQIEPSLGLANHHPTLPVAFATRIPAAFIQDHRSQRLFLIAEPSEHRLIEWMQADLKALAESDPYEPGPLLNGPLEEDSPERFLRHVQRIRSYIKEGDVFQVNLSRAWQGQIRAEVSAARVYARLRKQNPAPFAGLACYGATAIISSSPERLVMVREGIIETRPIAGTRPRTRGSPPGESAERQALLAHPKERAEHIMLLDLERNDLGRVCVPGSIKVDDLMAIESYTHVHHIVSNIHGRLRPTTTPGQVIRAVFPGGTITGCPKVRCMEIITELEQTPRGAYTGSMGYVNHDGSMDLNILIRTLVKSGRQVSFRAGAGIVADSIPEKELEETRAKARGLVLALI